MASHPPGRSSRAVIPLLVVALGAALVAGGALLLHSHTAGTSPAPRASRAPATAATAGAMRAAGIYSRLAPSVVDITATLRYDGETASGTGFVVDARDALVLTNNHVIRDATAVTARLGSTGRTYPARIVGTDAGADIAVLKLQGATGLTAAPLGDSAPVTAGTRVLAIENHAGTDGPPTAASGVVNGLDQTIRADDGASGFTETLHGMLETTVRIEPGDSGGPLAGPSGAVIGVDTAAGTGTSPAGYAIPIGAAMAAERQIAAGRAAPGITLGTGGFLGVVVTATASPSPRAQALQEQRLAGPGGRPSRAGCLDTEAEAGMPAALAPARSGALVDGVLCGTGAAQAGIAPGDVITAAAGHPVSSPDALTAIVNGCRPGTLVPVTWADVTGARRTSLVLLAAAPAV
jgi:S1-C subfamily serine protease